uniref:fatty acid 2-hydroxylase n=1 Tax=Ciona intestinalis TaxID=7719 RepID=UPI0000521121|nr:fatty acid 2-hydroxylase [Ciona intestinalis]|eukprot:XP_002126665.1 fatty acid 2-hydroxylase [Ciona intestinalis]
MPCLCDSEIQDAKKNNQTLIIHNEKVYDVTKFVNVHPGGSKILSLRHGKDVTNIMANAPHVHSKNAYRWLQQYYVADYKPENSTSLNGLNGPEIRDRKLSYNGKQNASPASNQLYEIKPTEDLINWNEPVLWQVGHLREKYHDWVDDPVDRSLRLFKSDFCEFFSKTPWYIIPLVWLPIVALFVLRSHTEFLAGKAMILHSLPGDGVVLSTNHMPVVFVSGILLWTFLEYGLHRWLFHSEPPKTSYFLITLHFLLHGQHHKVPFDSGRLVFPPVPASMLFLIAYSVFRLCFVVGVADIVSAGVILGYVGYDMTHYYLHYGQPKRGSYFDRLRAYHVRHHFESPNLGFGISSKLWDYPFQTTIKTNLKA